MKRSAVDLLTELLRDAGANVKFGLLAQGHMPIVEDMLDKGESWDAIGKRIGWAGSAVRRCYVLEVRMEAFKAGFVAHPEAEAPVFTWSFDPETCAAGDRWLHACQAWFEQRRAA